LPKEVHPSRGVVRIHLRQLAPMDRGSNDCVLQTIHDKALRCVMEAIVRRVLYAAPIVLPGFVLRMGFRILSGSYSPRRCIGCVAKGRGRSSASRLAGRLTLNGRFGLWCDG
jgi:hypothetical protein